jgi:DNA-directed RNA polymerase specialized sigma24 family protein
LTSASEPGPDELERLRAGLEILALRSLRDREAAEEAVQEMLMRAVEAVKQGRIKNLEKLGVFVRGIARHVIADMIRARK